MNANWFRNVSLAMLAVAGLAVSSAQAGSTQLGNSGWTASWDNSFDSRLDLSVDFESTDTVFLEKFVTFNTSDINESGGFIDPVVITFQQTSANAKEWLVLNDETVTNQTGLDWNGFKFTILDGSTGTSQDVQFDEAKTNLGDNAGFSINPFTTFQYSDNHQVLELGGGTVPTSPPFGPNVWFPGVEAGGLYIHASAIRDELRTFTLKETPLPGGPGNIIPLPAAAWSGLSGLAGLALIGSRKTLKKLFA